MPTPIERRLAALDALGNDAAPQRGSFTDMLAAADTPRARLEADIRNEEARVPRGLAPNSMEYRRLNELRSQLSNEMQREQMQSQRDQRSGESAAAQREALENAAQAEALLMGNADPRLAAALDVLQQQAQEGPMSESVQNMIAGRSADSAAAAAGSQQQMLMEQMARSGGSMQDASFGAASRDIEANRMLGNNAARRDIAIQAALQNFQGQQGAAQALGGLRNPMVSQLAGYYANAAVEDPNNQNRTMVNPQAAPVAMPNYSVPQRQPQVATPAPAPAPAPLPMPQGMDINGRLPVTGGSVTAPPSAAPGGIVTGGVNVTAPARPEGITRNGQVVQPRNLGNGITMGGRHIQGSEMSPQKGRNFRNY